MFLDNRLLETNMQAKPCATPTFYSEKISVWNPNRWCHKRDHQFRYIRATSRSSLETAHEPKDLERFGQWQTWRPKQTQSQHETNKITLSSIRLVTSPNYQATLQVYKDDHQEQFRHHHFCVDYWNSCGLNSYHLYHPVPYLYLILVRKSLGNLAPDPPRPQSLFVVRAGLSAPVHAGLGLSPDGSQPVMCDLGGRCLGRPCWSFLGWHMLTSRHERSNAQIRPVYGIYIYIILYIYIIYVFICSFIHSFIYLFFIYYLYMYLIYLFSCSIDLFI